MTLTVHLNARAQKIQLFLQGSILLFCILYLIHILHISFFLNSDIFIFLQMLSLTCIVFPFHPHLDMLNNFRQNKIQLRIIPCILSKWNKWHDSLLSWVNIGQRKV